MSTLRGLVNTARASVDVAATFDDGTVLTSLFDATRTPLYAGLVTFSSSRTDAASVHATRGEVTLRGNYYDTVQVTVAASGTAVRGTVAFACNLDPAVADVDVGNATGAPIRTLYPGNIVDVPVRVNSGTQFIGPFTFSIRYAATALEALPTVVEGDDLRSGGRAQFLLARTNDPPGVVSVTRHNACVAASIHVSDIGVCACCAQG